MPYGVCNSALGHNAAVARSVAMGTGAPAESTKRSFEKTECRPLAVLFTFKSAAGEANTMVAPTDVTAAANASAVKVPGAATSTLGIVEVMPNAGPYNANGAKAATKRSVSVMPYNVANTSRCAAICPWR